MMLWSSGSLGLTAQLRGDVVPTGAQPAIANYKLEWKGGGCEQWKSFGPTPRVGTEGVTALFEVTRVMCRWFVH